MKFLSFHIDLVKTHSVSLSAEHTTLSDDFIISFIIIIRGWNINKSRNPLVGWERCQAVSFFLLLTNVKTQIRQHNNNILSLNARRHTRQKTGMIECANSLLYAWTNNETTHCAWVSYVERQTFDCGGTHLFEQPIKWQWGASLAGNNSNEALPKCHASNITRQENWRASTFIYLLPLKALLFCQVWECHSSQKFIKAKQLSTCSYWLGICTCNWIMNLEYTIVVWYKLKQIGFNLYHHHRSIHPSYIWIYY